MSQKNESLDKATEIVKQQVASGASIKLIKANFLEVNQSEKDWEYIENKVQWKKDSLIKTKLFLFWVIWILVVNYIASLYLFKELFRTSASNEPLSFIVLYLWLIIEIFLLYRLILNNSKNETGIYLFVLFLVLNIVTGLLGSIFQLINSLIFLFGIFRISLVSVIFIELAILAYRIVLISIVDKLI